MQGTHHEVESDRWGKGWPGLAVGGIDCRQRHRAADPPHLDDPASLTLSLAHSVSPSLSLSLSLSLSWLLLSVVPTFHSDMVRGKGIRYHSHFAIGQQLPRPRQRDRLATLDLVAVGRLVGDAEGVETAVERVLPKDLVRTLTLL